jgi:hypothetical protein
MRMCIVEIVLAGAHARPFLQQRGWMVKAATCSIAMLLTATARGEAACERETIAMLLSPDNKWVALVREGVCTGGRITVSTDTVQLVPRDKLESIGLAHSPDEPQHENDVLVVDYYGHFENRPLLEWLSQNELQITIRNRKGVGLQKDNYQGLAIKLRSSP